MHCFVHTLLNGLHLCAVPVSVICLGGTVSLLPPELLTLLYVKLK
jgi:hypothetical protein